jgi:hypothetical protein
MWRHNAWLAELQDGLVLKKPVNRTTAIVPPP